MTFRPGAGQTEPFEMRHFLRAAAIVSSLYPILAGSLATARAEAIPPPSVDYQAKPTMIVVSGVMIHHSGGKMGMQIQPHGALPMIPGIVDLPARKMIMMRAVP